MKNPFFAKGHIARWVFFPPAWGGTGYWAEGFTDDEKKETFNHLKNCHTCREAEIEATLQWAALRPREPSAQDIIPSPKDTSQNDPVIEPSFDTYPRFPRKVRNT